MNSTSMPSVISRWPGLKRAALNVLGTSTIALLTAGAAHAALLDRDLDKNGVTDAFYDTDLDITWLRDANVNGAQGWNEATSWAASFSIGAFNDWRLPTVRSYWVQVDTGVIFIRGEIRQLWGGALGNPDGGPLTNVGGFQNVQSFWYWTADSPGGGPGSAIAEAFDFRDGNSDFQYTAASSNQLYAMAVTNGDVGLVPEPGTYALLLVGLAGIGVAAARRK